MAAVVQSLDRAFSILEAVAARPAGVTEIAARVGLAKSTAARLLASLERLGAVERVPGGSDWRLGPTFASLAGASAPQRNLVSLARPYLAGIVSALGEDAGLALPDGHAVLYVDQVEADQAVQVRDWTGTRAPMHTVPSGLVLLAEWPVAAIDAYLARPLERLTTHTVVDPALLRARLADVRGRGHAWGIEEYADGISSVAAPVRDARGRAIAAIHCHGPSYRFPPDAAGEAAAAGSVASAAGAVTELLRGAGP